MNKIILTLITSVLLSSSVALAECNFIVNIGDKSTKILKKYGQPMPMFQGQFMMPVPSTEVCPSDNLNDEIAIEFIFLGETAEDSRLAAIRMVVFNDGKNTVSNQLTLMNYAKKVYGTFDTGNNPKAFNNFNVWDKNQKLVLYKRMTNEKELIDEELYITNKEYDQKLGDFYNQLEMNAMQEDLN